MWKICFETREQTPVCQRAASSVRDGIHEASSLSDRVLFVQVRLHGFFCRGREQKERATVKAMEPLRYYCVVCYPDSWRAAQDGRSLYSSNRVPQEAHPSLCSSQRTQRIVCGLTHPTSHFVYILYISTREKKTAYSTVCTRHDVQYCHTDCAALKHQK